MTVEMTPDEAKLLIAVLTAADETLTGPIALALLDLRTWRSALLQAYLRSEGARVTEDRA